MLRDRTGALIDGFNARVVNVPSLISQLELVHHDAEFILIIEKECSFEVRIHGVNHRNHSGTVTLICSLFVI